MREKEL